MEAVHLPARRRRRPAREHRVARRAAHALPHPVEHAHREHLQPRRRHRDERTHERRHAVAEQHEAALHARLSDSRPDTTLRMLLAASAAPSTMPSGERAGAEDLGQKERQQRVDGFARGVGGQAHPAEQPDRPREVEEAGPGLGHALLLSHIRDRTMHVSPPGVQWILVHHAHPGRRPRARNARGRAVRRAPRRPPALLRVRPPLPAARRRDRRLQGALQPRRPAAACRGATSAACSAIRSRRSRSSTRIRARSRYSFGMLGCDLHCAYCQNWVTSQALRDPQAVAPPLDADARASSCAMRVGARRARRRQHLQRAADHQRVGGRGLQGGASRRARRPGSCPTATARRRCSSTCGRGSTSTRSISRASTTATTASSAARSSRSSTRSAGCTRWASGSRS